MFASALLRQTIKSFFVTGCILGCSLTISPLTAEAVTVEETILQAFRYSPMLKSFREDISIADYDKKSSMANFLPTIGIWANIGASQASNTTTRFYGNDNKFEDYNGFGATLRQPLYAGGQNKARYEASKLNQVSSKENFLDNANSLAYDALFAHADLIRRFKLVDYATKNVDEHKKILRTTMLRFDQGVITHGEVTQVQSRLARAEANMYMHLTGLDAAKANYLKVVGREAERDLEDIFKPLRTFEKSDHIYELALSQNPKLQSLKLANEISHQDQLVARGKFLPQVYGQVAYSNTYLDGEGSGKVDDLNFSLNMEWNVFNGGADKAELEKAKNRTKKSQLEIQQFEDQLKQEIYTTFVQTYNSFEQADLYKDSMGYAKSTRENFLSQFQTGKRGLLDILDAESEFFSSSVDHEIAYIDAIMGQYRLLALSGTLLKELKLENTVDNLIK